ncbi:hypothetical protein ACPCXF_16090 [Lysinibacillus agricola]
MKHVKACFISVIVQTVCQQSLWHAVFLFQVKNCAYFGRPQEALLCAKAKRQRQMFYLCESEATATKRPAGTEINPRYDKLSFLNKI